MTVDFNGQNKSIETYVGHDYIVLNEKLNLVFFRDVIEKADSIFYEWIDHKPKYMEFKQSDRNI